MTLHMFMDALQQLRGALRGAAVRITEQEQTQTRTLLSSITAQLSFPWCGRRLNWTILLQTLPPYAVGPDFLFDDPTYLPLCGSLRPDLHARLTQLLYSWPAACTGQGQFTVAGLLQAIVQTLVSGFQEHQLAKLSDTHNDRLQFELSTLPDLLPAVMGPEPGQPLLETLLTDNYKSPSEPLQACLGIPLNGLDLTRAAATVTDLTPSQGSWVTQTHTQGQGQASPYQLQQQQQYLAAGCKLQVAFPLSGGKTDPSLSIQVPDVIECGGGWVPPALPVWDPHSCLMDYIPQTVLRLQTALDAWSQNVAIRKQLLEALTGSLGSGPPLELNLREGSGMWAVTWEQKPLLIHIQCSVYMTGGAASVIFPDQKPTLTVTSVKTLGLPSGSKSFTDYPWSPRWPADEMASRILTFLKTEIATFLAPPPQPPATPAPGVSYAAAATAAAAATGGAAGAAPVGVSGVGGAVVGVVGVGAGGIGAGGTQSQGGASQVSSSAVSQSHTPR